MEVSVRSFQLLPTLVAGTRRVALIQRRLAELMAPVARLRVLPCPFEAVPAQEALWWHPLHTQDAARIWLRETAARVAAGLTGHASGPAPTSPDAIGRGCADVPGGMGGLGIA